VAAHHGADVIIQLMRNTFRIVQTRLGRPADGPQTDLPTPSTPTPPARAFQTMSEKWGKQYPAVVRLWDNAWQEFIPFLDYNIEIRRVLCSTNAIECFNARSHFPTEATALIDLIQPGEVAECHCGA
jgi:putative transposase